MTDEFELSRRKILGAVGGVGVASAGAGMGTSAFFSDTESFETNQLTAGELDLVIDFEEHYSDWSDDEKQAIENAGGSFRMIGPNDSLQTGEVGLPTQSDPLIAITDENGSTDGDAVKAFMDATAIDAFPDTADNGGTADDGIQDVIPTNNKEGDESAECNYLQPKVPDDGDILSADARTQNTLPESGEGNTQTTEKGDPLVEISDVKPGDFGEVTFSLHLCGNPGFIELNGEVVSQAENGRTEPEKEVDSTSDSGELLQNTMGVLWYDAGENGVFDDTDPDAGEGDNILQANEEIIGDETMNRVLKGPLDNVLPLLQDGVPLDGDLSTSFNELDPNPSGTTETITNRDGFEKNFFSDDDSADGDRVDDIVPSCFGLGYLEAEKIDTARNDIGEFGDIHDELTDSNSTDEDDDPTTVDQGSTVDLLTDAGVATVTDMSLDGDGEVEWIEISTDFPVTAVIAKGGPRGEIWEEPSGAFLDTVRFRAPDNTALSYLGICYEGDSGNGDDPGRDPFPNSTTAYIGFAWWVPPQVGNVIQSDSLSFNLGFAAEQARHNDDPSV